MSIITSSQLNPDQLLTALQALESGATFTSSGASLNSTGSKTITAIGATDAQLTSAISTAASQYVNYATNQTTIISNIQAHQATIQTWIAANPTGAVLTAAQTLVLAQMLNGLCNLLLQEFSSTTGT